MRDLKNIEEIDTIQNKIQVLNVFRHDIQRCCSLVSRMPQ